MTMTDSTSSHACRTFEVRPNRSLSPTGMLIFFLVVTVLSLVVALRFLLLGVWLVLPFTLLELLVLGVSLYLFERHSRYSETLRICPDDILFIARRGVKILQECRFQTHWVSIVLQLDQQSWYPSRLLLQSHGKSIEIGACLTDEDRKAFAATIQATLEECRRMS
ncbi:DUF2244 domain-containing protein [Thiothrix winogradskyi]|uniref:DUF2244 domain-containing protein n=1 Tax=Thiothrix winogradskyi TaxID=96472 RepID=A0ABY3T122_9GAMM|nr:DUF2244 domain-containing protein [Thiothrix winogradskyi]UJS24461.1 DUF2244 domain-containing protein [Thiothrix winogradskyi]